MSSSLLCSQNVVFDTCSCLVEGCKYTDIDMWPLLRLVDLELRSKIRLIYSFGPGGTEIVFTTTDNQVCGLIQ